MTTLSALLDEYEGHSVEEERPLRRVAEILASAHATVPVTITAALLLVESAAGRRVYLRRWLAEDADGGAVAWVCYGATRVPRWIPLADEERAAYLRQPETGEPDVWDLPDHG